MYNKQTQGQRPCTIVHGSLAKFHQKSLGENSSFYNLLILMLRRKFDWIFYEFLKLLQNQAKDPVL